MATVPFSLSMSMPVLGRLSMSMTGLGANGRLNGWTVLGVSIKLRTVLGVACSPSVCTTLLMVVCGLAGHLQTTVSHGTVDRLTLLHRPQILEAPPFPRDSLYSLPRGPPRIVYRWGALVAHWWRDRNIPRTGPGEKNGNPTERVGPVRSSAIQGSALPLRASSWST